MSIQNFFERNQKNFEVIGKAINDYRIVGEVALFGLCLFLTIKEGRLGNKPTPFMPKIRVITNSVPANPFGPK
jgi:hypothetical protein